MDSAALMREIARLEDQLLTATVEIRETAQRDSLNAWITAVLGRRSTLAQRLGFPTDPPVVRALLVLLRAESELRSPLTTMLAQRTAAFVATIPDVCAHPLCGERLNSSAENVAHLRRLLAEYQLTTNVERQCG